MSTPVEQAAQDLMDAGPGGICDDCGHFAARHHGYGCCFPYEDTACPCRGMVWRGERILMRINSGPVMNRG